MNQRQMPTRKCIEFHGVVRGGSNLVGLPGGGSRREQECGDSRGLEMCLTTTGHGVSSGCPRTWHMEPTLSHRLPKSALNLCTFVVTGKRSRNVRIRMRAGHASLGTVRVISPVPQQAGAKMGGFGAGVGQMMIALTMMLAAPLAAHPAQVSGTDPAFRSGSAAKKRIGIGGEKQSHTQAKHIRRCPFWL